jgi:hypothetical protein
MYGIGMLLFAFATESWMMFAFLFGCWQFYDCLFFAEELTTQPLQPLHHGLLPVSKPATT